jgi:biopolymer transport protein ExbD
MRSGTGHTDETVRMTQATEKKSAFLARVMSVFDIALAFVALLLAVVAFRGTAEETLPLEPIALDSSQPLSGAVAMRVDGANRIHFDGRTVDRSDLMAQLEEGGRSFDQVRVEIEPDALMQTVVGLVVLLRGAGAESVQLVSVGP